MKNTDGMGHSAVDVGGRIKKIRAMIGLTQEQLAAELNVARPALAQWERGGNMATIAAMIRFAQLSHTTLDFIYQGDISSLSYRSAQKIFGKKLYHSQDVDLSDVG